MSIIDFAIHTGMRKEAITDYVGHGAFEKFITLPPEITTNKSRNVPLQPKAIQILKEMPRSINGKIFPIELRILRDLGIASAGDLKRKGLRFMT